MSNSYGIDMGTNNLKIYSSNSSEIINVKNTIAIVDKDQMYAYGDDACNGTKRCRSYRYSSCRWCIHGYFRCII